VQFLPCICSAPAFNEVVKSKSTMPCRRLVQQPHNNSVTLTGANNELFVHETISARTELIESGCFASKLEAMFSNLVTSGSDCYVDVSGRRLRRVSIGGTVLPWGHMFCLKKVRQLCLDQWFLTFFTYHTLLSNKITRITPNTLNRAHLLKTWS